MGFDDFLTLEMDKIIDFLLVIMQNKFFLLDKTHPEINMCLNVFYYIIIHMETSSSSQSTTEDIQVQNNQEDREMKKLQQQLRR